MKKVFKQNEKIIHLSSINDFSNQSLENFSNSTIYYKGSRKFKLEKSFNLII